MRAPPQAVDRPALLVTLLLDGDPALQSSVLGGVCAGGLRRLLPSGLIVDVPAWPIALAGAAPGQHPADFEEIPHHGGGVSRGR